MAKINASALTDGAKRLKTLTMMQLKNKRNKSGKKKINILVNVLLRILLAAVVTFAIYYALNFIKTYDVFPIDKHLLLLMLFVTQYISILSCMSGFSSLMYSSRDNMIIFPLPARPTEIFASKLIVYYISELQRNLYFILPFFIAFGMVLKLTFGFFFYVIVLTFLLPLIAVILGALLSVPYMLLKRLFKKIPFLKLAVVLTIIGLVMWLLIYIVNIIPRPLRLVAIYGAFSRWLSGFIVSANKFSTFYRYVLNIGLGKDVGASVGIVIGVIVGISLLCWLLSLCYFTIASSAQETSAKGRRVGKNTPAKTTFGTFLKKELISDIRDVEQVISNFMYIIAMPFVLYLLNQVFDAIATSGFGTQIIIVINVLIGLLLLLSSNTMSATAISSEGSEFGLVKSSPANYAYLCYAKMFLNFVLSLLSIVATTIMFSVTTDLGPQNIGLLFLIFITLSVGHILWSMQLDILNPKLQDAARQGSTKNNPNIGKSILIGVFIAAVAAVLTWFFVGLGGNAAWKILIFCFIFLILRIVLFIINMKVYFKRIEY